VLGWTALLDPPEFPAQGYGALADRTARLLGTRSDIVFVQAEAVLALEAVASSLCRPGVVALNVVTSGYGVAVGAWLRSAGATVHDLASEPGRPIGEAAVAQALAALPRVDLVVWTHGETSTGVVNPLVGIAELARSKGALTIVDAVASVAAHKIDFDAIDVVVLGPQKGLAGPAGVSLVVCSEPAWAHMATCGVADPSLLSLRGIKRNWIDQGRGALPGTPPALEFWALDAAIARAEAEGLDRIVARHTRAARATRAGLRAMGVTLWIEDDDCASHLATSIVVPAGLDADTIVGACQKRHVRLNQAGGVRGQLVRLDHMGLAACDEGVIAGLVGFGRVLRELGCFVDIGKAVEEALLF